MNGDPKTQALVDEIAALEVPEDIQPGWVITQNRITYWWWQVDDDDKYRDVMKTSRKWLRLTKPVFEKYPGKFLNGASGLDYVGLAYILTED